MALLWLGDYLRAEGLRVVERRGWQTFGRPGPFRPVGVTWHHTWVPTSDSNPHAGLSTIVDGRPDLGGPLAQLLPSRTGEVHLVSGGRCNHAGAADGVGTGPIPAGDGNALMVGLEIDYNADHKSNLSPAGDGPVRPQYLCSIGAAAAVLRGLAERERTIPRADASRAVGHLESSKTGKWDPGMAGRRTVNLRAWRADLAVCLSESPGVWYRRETGQLAGPSRVLRLTDPLTRGEDVRVVQRWAQVADDGVYGPATAAAVAARQAARGLTADGAVGPTTWAVVLTSTATTAPPSAARPSEEDLMLVTAPGKAWYIRDVDGLLTVVPNDWPAAKSQAAFGPVREVPVLVFDRWARKSAAVEKQLGLNA